MRPASLLSSKRKLTLQNDTQIPLLAHALSASDTLLVPPQTQGRTNCVVGRRHLLCELVETADLRAFCVFCIDVAGLIAC